MTGRLLLLAALILGIQAMTRSCGASAQSTAGQKTTFASAMLHSMAEEMKTALYDQYMPGVLFASRGGRGLGWLFWEQLNSLFPFYGYLAGEAWEEGERSAEEFRTILLAEAEEGIHFQEEPLPGELPSGEIISPEETVPGKETLEELLRTENEAAIQQQMQEQQVDQGQLVQEQPAGFDFLPHDRLIQVDLEPLRDYETLVRQFYTVDGNTKAGSGDLDVDKFLAADMSISKDSDGPQILIYHTHSQEGYSDSVPGDESMSIMGVGDRLTAILTEQYGYQVLHHRGKYDVESRDDAYSNSLGDIERVLEENPSIQVVIDLHRDAVPEETRLVMEVDGKPTARFMFFNGLSRTRSTGNISYLYNENLDSNLAFSFQMQLKAMEYYPGLPRRIYLKAYRYNMHLKPRYLLIELGAQNNTLEEAMNACGPLAHILDLVLSGE